MERVNYFFLRNFTFFSFSYIGACSKKTGASNDAHTACPEHFDMPEPICRATFFVSLLLFLSRRPPPEAL